MSSPGTAAANERHASPWLLAAGVVCAVECLGLLAMAGIEASATTSERLSLGVTTTIFFVVYAAGLGFAAWGIARVRSWARSPLVLTQCIQLGLAWSFLGSSTAWLSALLAASAAFVLVVVLLPSSTRALYGAGAKPSS